MAEMTLKMNAFESLTMEEMMAVDGGGKKIDFAALLIGIGGGVFSVAAAVGAVTVSPGVAAGVAIGCAAVAVYAYGCNYATQRTPSNYNITRRR